MPIDSNIALSVKPVQIQNPMDQYAQFAQVQQAQNQNRLADLMFSEKQRELAADNALAGLLSAGKSGADITNGLASQGFGNKAIAYTKQLQETEKQKADIAKTNAEASKFNVEAAQKKFDIAGQAFGFVRANPTLENAHAALDYLAQHGLYTPEQVAQSKAQLAADPSKIPALAEQAFRSALSAKDQLAKYETRNLGGTTDTLQIDPVTGKTMVVNSVKNTVSPDAALSSSTQLKTTAMNNAVAMRGQDKPTWDSERGVFVSPNGAAIQVKGADGQPIGPKDKPLTEDQGKATTFAARMVDANRTLSELEAKGITSKDLSTQAAASKLTNWLASPDGQRYRQAQENWVTANLRKESGAVIGKDEMSAEIQKYFPIPGDSPGVIAQKSKARAVAQQGMMTQAGPGAKQVGAISSAGAAPVASPKVGAVENGYRFKGGNPADQSSWEKL